MPLPWRISIGGLVFKSSPTSVVLCPKKDNGEFVAISSKVQNSEVPSTKKHEAKTKTTQIGNKKHSIFL